MKKRDIFGVSRGASVDIAKDIANLLKADDVLIFVSKRKLGSSEGAVIGSTVDLEFLLGAYLSMKEVFDGVDEILKKDGQRGLYDLSNEMIAKINGERKDMLVN